MTCSESGGGRKWRLNYLSRRCNTAAAICLELLFQLRPRSAALTSPPVQEGSAAFFDRGGGEGRNERSIRSGFCHWRISVRIPRPNTCLMELQRRSLI